MTRAHLQSGILSRLIQPQIWITFPVAVLIILVSACAEEPSTERQGRTTPVTPSPYIFTESFRDNAQGWSLDEEWEIGPARASTPPNGNPDPAFDHSAGADNGIAGVVIGGQYRVQFHDYRYLTSPVIPLTDPESAYQLSFHRWLNSDYDPHVFNSIEVFDGSGWVVLWEGPKCCTFIFDSEWVPIAFDITSYANTMFRVRFGHKVVDEETLAVCGGWNLDDLIIIKL